MLVLLTGGTGMVGSHVAKALSEAGHSVRCLMRKPEQPGLLEGLHIEPVAGDVTHADSLAQAVVGVDAVVHVAGVVSYWKPRAARQWEVNVEGTRTLIEAAAQAGVRRFVVTSSIAAVGYVENDDLGDEDTPYNWGPFDIAYCETKRASEKLVLEDTRIEGVAVNPGIVIGPQDIHMGGGRIVAQVYSGDVPAIPCGATTVATANDVAQGHLLALESGQAGRRYILGGHPMSFKQLFGLCAEVLGKKPTGKVLSPALMTGAAYLMNAWSHVVQKEPRLTPQLAALSVRNRRYTSQRAISELGFSVSNLEDAIDAAARWYVDQGILNP